jgi:hypothetical protein
MLVNQTRIRLDVCAELQLTYRFVLLGTLFVFPHSELRTTHVCCPNVFVSTLIKWLDGVQRHCTKC